jgi:hypothetical protein
VDRLAGPLSARLEHPVRQHTSGQVASNQSKHPPVGYTHGHRGHQPVVVDPIEEFRQVDIHDDPMALGN